MGGFRSSAAPVKYGISQGSVLAHILFSIYMLPLGQIICKYDVSFYCCADDMQLYVQLRSKNGSQIVSVTTWIILSASWWVNFFSLMRIKLLWSLPSDTASVVHHLGHLSSYVRCHGRNLGVIFDAKLKFKLFLFPDLEKVIHAIISPTFGLL